jgi:aspartyl-tRNA(Asn)/glutamyl-tRNA(Gln) amidotransferase subunit B
MSWEVVIGLETHAQLSTKSKIFSSASTAFGAAPNTQASVVDMALPGSLPVLNKGAVERAIRFGIAVEGIINPRSLFARKNYFYPDLPKGYQISQYELPIVQGGKIPIVSPTRGEIRIQLTRAHLEEDAGKSIHGEALSGVVGYAVAGYAVVGRPLNDGTIDLTKVSGIDLNRAGTPLLEIVSEPEMNSAEEAVAYAKSLHSLVTWLDICDGNMQEGSFRCDANVSVRRPGAPLGTRREIKNLNSFRFLQQAIEYEIKWQIETLEDGGKIQQATVLFDPDTGETRVMRLKEDAHDYRYFPDPDLLPLEIAPEWMDEIKADVPELPWEKAAEYQELYGLSPAVASQLTSTREKSLFFEKACIQNSDTDFPITLLGNPAFVKRVANWVVGEISRKLNEDGGETWQFWMSPEALGRLVLREHEGTIAAKTAKDLFNSFWDADRNARARRSADKIDSEIEAQGLKQISDSGAIGKIVDQVIAANAQQVADYRSGKEKAFNSLVGQVMKASQGKANPVQVNEILKKKLR